MFLPLKVFCWLSIASSTFHLHVTHRALKSTRGLSTVGSDEATKTGWDCAQCQESGWAWRHEPPKTSGAAFGSSRPPSGGGDRLVPVLYSSRHLC